jgi:large subunit ribosomal protein L35
MPKQKTHKGTAKRFQVSGSGKLQRRKAFASHNRSVQNADRLRSKHGVVEIATADEKRAKRLLGLR